MDRAQFAFVLTWIFVIEHAQGAINLQGCTEAFFRMTCPSDDILQIYDVRFSEVDPGHPCSQQKPPNAVIPEEMTEECLPSNKTGEEGLLCTYMENMCNNKNDCVFYISPHLIAGKESPTVNSEVIIKYECKPGKKRKAEIGVATFVAVFTIGCLLTVGGLLMWRELTRSPSPYQAESPSPNQSNPEYETQPSQSGSHHESSQAVAVINNDQISVNFQTTSSGLSHRAI